MWPNTNSERMLLENEYELDVFSTQSEYGYKEIIGSCIIMSQLENGREINILI
jgi:hypothetical protein